MRLKILVLAFGLLAAAPALADPVKIGKPFDLHTTMCPREEDMMDIVSYARAHKGDGLSAYYGKQAAHLCGQFDTLDLGPDMAVVDKVIDEYTDALLGDTLIIVFHITVDPDVSLYGILGPEKIDGTSL